MRENLAATLRLLLVTDDALLGARDPIVVARAAVAGGVTAIQLRLKHASDRELLALARHLVALLPVPIFVNDRLDVALAAGAAGVHLGPDDLPPERARRIVPAGFLLGASVGSLPEIERGRAADYWGIGPLHGTATKGDAGAALGLEGAAALLAHAGGRPCVVIGGVQPDDVEPALAAGFAGVAVVSGILGGEDVEGAARRYRSSMIDHR
jgi:thiamine-phosphate pyrophosphorylase